MVLGVVDAFYKPITILPITKLGSWRHSYYCLKIIKCFNVTIDNRISIACTQCIANLTVYARELNINQCCTNIKMWRLVITLALVDMGIIGESLCSAVDSKFFYYYATELDLQLFFLRRTQTKISHPIVNHYSRF